LNTIGVSDCALLDINLTTLRNRSLVYFFPFPDLDQRIRRLLASTNHSLFLLFHDWDWFPYTMYKVMAQEPRVLKIFAINVPDDFRNHSKIVPLPYGVGTDPTRIKAAVARKANCTTEDPTEPLLVAFGLNDPQKMVLRQRVLAQLRAAGSFGATAHLHKVPPDQWVEQVLAHRFNAAPPGGRGRAMDTWRFWETLALGRVPVAESVVPPSLYADLPVVEVENWTNITFAHLSKEWAALARRRYNLQRLHILWWARYILHHVLLTP